MQHGSPTAEITIAPPSGAWNLHRAHPALPEGAPSASGFRSQLGLPADRPIILTGHQAEFWHPGILAKYLAAQAASARRDAAVGWIVVDQDSNAPGEIRYPATDEQGHLVRRTWNAFPATEALIEANVPLSSIPAATPAALDVAEGLHLLPSVNAGLQRIHAALLAHQGAPSIAHQAALALRDCLAPVLRPAPIVFASTLSRTELFQWVLRRMQADPAACARPYNRAVAAHPSARMAPLAEGADPELPLWHIATGKSSRRTRARASHLEAPGVLAPRALLMTGVLRMAGCELFIHGLGGGVYDTITEQWMREWLAVDLAPTAVVTATLRLPLGKDDITPREIDRAAWTAHHARHDPRLLDDPAAADRKAALVQRIRELKHAGQDPAPAFRELQALLADVRRSASDRLERLEQAASDARSRRTETALAHERTWPAPLYEPAALVRLREEIEARIA